MTETYLLTIEPSAGSFLLIERASGGDVLTRRRKADVAIALRRMVKRIVNRFAPERIILFGSHARGTANADSDVDLLVVMTVKGSKRRQAVEIGVALHDVAFPKDIVVSSPEEFNWRKDVVGTIEYPAAREGRLLYAKS